MYAREDLNEFLGSGVVQRPQRIPLAASQYSRYSGLELEPSSSSPLRRDSEAASEDHHDRLSFDHGQSLLDRDGVCSIGSDLQTKMLETLMDRLNVQESLLRSILERVSQREAENGFRHDSDKPTDAASTSLGSFLGQGMGRNLNSPSLKPNN